MSSSLQPPLYTPKIWQNCASKGCTVLPELAKTGSQKSNQNWAVLAARTGARTAQFWQPEQQPALLFWPELCCQNWQHSSERSRQFWQQNTTARNPRLAVHMYQSSHQKKILAVQEKQCICSQDYTESIHNSIYMVKPVRIGAIGPRHSAETKNRVSYTHEV